MEFIRDFFSGIQAYGVAIKLLFSKKLWFFMLFPVVWAVLMFVAGDYLFESFLNNILLMAETKVLEWTEGSWLEYFSKMVISCINFVLPFLFLALFILFGGYLVMIVMSPVYSWLSERTEAIVSGREYSFDLKQLIWEMGRGIMISLRCIVLQLLVTVLLFCCFVVIPVVGWMAPILSFGVSAYFYGIAFMDYAIERKHFRVKESMRYMRHNAGAVLAIGLVFALLVLILPWLNCYLWWQEQWL